MIKDRPQRLDRIFSRAPVFFITFCTRNRKRIDPLNSANNALVKYGKEALEKFNVAVGRYVIMPDHVHFFVRGDANFVLSRWVGGLKHAIELRLRETGTLAIRNDGFHKYPPSQKIDDQSPRGGTSRERWKPPLFISDNSSQRPVLRPSRNILRAMTPIGATRWGRGGSGDLDYVPRI